MQTGQIWLIDKDTEDHDIVQEVLHELRQYMINYWLKSKMSSKIGKM